MTADEGLRPLHIACRRPQLPVVHLLVQWGALLDAPEAAAWWTALHLAAAKGLATTCKALATAGASLEARDREGHTPLHLTALAGHSSTALQLLEVGASPRLLNAEGYAPIHCAAVQVRLPWGRFTPPPPPEKVLVVVGGGGRSRKVASMSHRHISAGQVWHCMSYYAPDHRFHHLMGHQRLLQHLFRQLLVLLTCCSINAQPTDR